MHFSVHPASKPKANSRHCTQLTLCVGSSTHADTHGHALEWRDHPTSPMGIYGPPQRMPR
eukprot:5842034-Amphidinium_carterae.1